MRNNYSFLIIPHLLPASRCSQSQSSAVSSCPHSSFNNYSDYHLLPISYHLLQIPTTPVGVDQLTDSGSLALDEALSVFVQGDFAYVMGQLDNGLQLLSLGGDEFGTLEVGAFAASSLALDNHAQFSNYVDVKGGLSEGFSANINGGLNVGGKIKASSVDFSGLPVYADEAAVVAASLPSGYLYQTSTGEIRIKL